MQGTLRFVVLYSAFRAISPHQPPSGTIHSSFKTNERARITHPFGKIYLKEFNFCGTYPLVCLRHRADQILHVARVKSNN